MTKRTFIMTGPESIEYQSGILAHLFRNGDHGEKRLPE